jgi:hypothetical protein
MAKFMLNICYGSRAGSEHPEDDNFVMSKYQEWSEMQLLWLTWNFIKRPLRVKACQNFMNW